MRKDMQMPYEISPFVADVAKEDRAAAMAFFLQDNAQSIYGTWRGNMKATDQRALFGRYIGKGVIIIDGAYETVDHNISVSFGTMRASVWFKTWRELLH